MVAHRKSRGGALLTALFIMTMVAIVATAMSVRLQLDIYRTRMIINYNKTYLATQAISFWAFNELSKDKISYKNVSKEGVVTRYPLELSKQIENISLSGEIYDLQSRFNLNNLLDNQFIPSFINLIHNTQPQLESRERTNLVLAIRNFIKNYDLESGTDAFTSYYHSLSPPYNPSHQAFKSTSELRLVKNVNPSVFLALEPYVTALPEKTAININSAQAPVIQSLGNNLRRDQVDELIKIRQEKNQDTLQRISEIVKKLDIPNDQITLESTYFLCKATAQYEDTKVSVYSLIKRTKNTKGRIRIELVRESINGF